MSSVSSRRSPTPLLVVAVIVVVLLVIGSIVTGQVWLTVLGIVALAAAAVPLRNRR
jgi:hypothetical protein